MCYRNTLKIILLIFILHSFAYISHKNNFFINNYVYAQGEGDDNSADPPPDIEEDDEDPFWPDDNDEEEEPTLPDTPINADNFIIFLGISFVVLSIAIYTTGILHAKEENVMDNLSK